MTHEERVSKIGDIICHMCKNSWTGHLCLDNELGLRLYCEFCDLFIWMEKEFEIFISLSQTAKLVNATPQELTDVLLPISAFSRELPKHPIHELRKKYRYKTTKD